MVRKELISLLSASGDVVLSIREEAQSIGGQTLDDWHSLRAFCPLGPLSDEGAFHTLLETVVDSVGHPCSHFELCPFAVGLTLLLAGKKVGLYLPLRRRSLIHLSGGRLLLTHETGEAVDVSEMKDVWKEEGRVDGVATAVCFDTLGRWLIRMEKM